MTDALVQQPDDDLAANLDFVRRPVDVGHPVERLLRRRNVVTHRSEKNNRRLDLPQIKGLTALPVGGTGPELVADEEIARDPLDLLAIHEIEAAPPAFEFEEARWLGIDVREDVVVLVPERVGRVEVLEILDQIRSVEDSVAEVGGKGRKPGPAEQAAGVAHRVVAGALVP